jgi:hypothetical protein
MTEEARKLKDRERKRHRAAAMTDIERGEVRAWEDKVRCVQSADRQPPATDLWLNRFEPDDHRVAVDRPPSPVLSRWYSRWVLKLRVPSSSHRCARLVLLYGRYIHLPRASHSLSAGLSFTSMGFHARDARWHARAGLPPARCEPGLRGQRSQACAERSLPCSVVSQVRLSWLSMPGYRVML